MENIKRHQKDEKPKWNCFTLAFNKKKLEDKYEEESVYSRYVMKYIFTLLGVTFSLIAFIYIYLFSLTPFEKKFKIPVRTSLFFGYQALSCNVVCFIQMFFIKKFPVLNKAFLYVSFCCLSLSLYSLITMLSTLLVLDDLLDYSYIIYCMEFAIKICYILLVDNNFLRIFCVNSALILNLWVAQHELCDKQFMKRKNYFVSITISYTLFTIFSYILEKYSKKVFWLSSKVIKQKDNFLNILNNMQNGLFTFDLHKKKIKFVNNYLKKYSTFEDTEPKVMEADYLPTQKGSNKNGSEGMNFPYQLSVIDPDTTTLKTINTVKNIYDHLDKYNIFKFIFDENMQIDKDIRASFRKSSFIEILQAFVNTYSCDIMSENVDDIMLKNFNNSCYMNIGHILLLKKKKQKTFEFQLRAIKKDNKNYIFEFLFNNVTLTKKLEEDKIKTKTMILAKISHEFKNPLIVICEVIEEVIEISDYVNLNSINDDSKIKNLKFVQNLCHYMILLVKDFETVSSLENNKPIDIFKADVPLAEYLEGIEQIMYALIKKKDAIDDINFEMNIDDNIRMIYTDRMRLSQILINLLSNSIKFTNKGYVKLTISDVTKMIEDKTMETDEGDEIVGQLDHLLNPPTIKAVNALDEVNLVEEVDLKEYRTIKISISDSGKGVSDDMQADLFKGMNKDNSAGNIIGGGYGLGIVEKLCLALGSKIKYQKDETKGSTFFFYLKQEITDSMNGDDDLAFKKSSNTLEKLKFSSNIKCSIQPSKIGNNERMKEFIKDSELIKDIVKTHKFTRSNTMEIGFKSPSKRTNFKYEDEAIDTDQTIKQNIVFQIPEKLKNLHGIKCNDSEFKRDIEIIENKEPTIRNKNVNLEIIEDDELTIRHKNVKIPLPKVPLTTRTREYSPLDDSCEILLRNSSDKEGSDTFDSTKSLKKIELLPLTKSKFIPEKIEEAKKLDCIRTINFAIMSDKKEIIKEINTAIKTSNTLPEVNESPAVNFDLKINHKVFNYTADGPKITICVIIVDDEIFIRNAMVRVLTKQVETQKKNIDLTIIEACDGLECAAALYVANNKNIKINCIISDETMKFLTGSYSSKVIEQMISSGAINDVPMYIVTALGQDFNYNCSYSKIIKKVYSKPVDKTNILDILKQCKAI